MKSFNQIKLLFKTLIKIIIAMIINKKIKKNGRRFNNKSNFNNYKNKMLILNKIMEKKVTRFKIKVKIYHKKKNYR
jgi:hypothetical protein